MKRDTARLIIHKFDLAKTQNVNFILSNSKPFLTFVGEGFLLQINENLISKLTDLKVSIIYNASAFPCRITFYKI